MQPAQLTKPGSSPSSASAPRPATPIVSKPSEDGDSVDRLAALGVPVVVLEVKPQGELVQGQRGGDPVRGGGQARRPFRRALADPEAIRPQVADPEQAEDPERAVVDVAATGADVPKRPALGADRVGDPPGDGERRGEADRAEERALLAGLGEVAGVEPVQLHVTRLLGPAGGS